MTEEKKTENQVNQRKAVTLQVNRKKAITLHVKVIMKHYEEQWRKSTIDIRNAFSTYVIDHVIGDFIRDTKGEMDAQKAMAQELYLEYMEAWEEMYGEKGTERKSSVPQNAV